MREWWNSHRFVRAGSHRFVRKRFWQTLIVRMNSLRVCKHESPVDLFSKILVCVSFLHPKTGWWLRASDNSMLGPRDGSLKSQTLFLPLTTPSSFSPSSGKAAIFCQVTAENLSWYVWAHSVGFRWKRASQIIFSPWKKSSPSHDFGKNSAVKSPSLVRPRKESLEFLICHCKSSLKKGLELVWLFDCID